jgi:hypothetical protein
MRKLGNTPPAFLGGLALSVSGRGQRLPQDFDHEPCRLERASIVLQRIRKAMKGDLERVALEGALEGGAAPGRPLRRRSLPAVKPPAPQILRRGAVIRVAGAGDDATLAAPAYAISFVDLRFDDGHVERWLGHSRQRIVDRRACRIAASTSLPM